MTYSLKHIEGEVCRRSLHEFVKRAWHVVEPEHGFVDGKHIRAICTHLEAVWAGKIRNLIINVPPRHSKSGIVSVFWPAWIWAQKPTIQFLTSSYAMDLATRDNLRMRRLVTSDWYRETMVDTLPDGDKRRFVLTGDQNSKIKFETDRNGYRQATSVESQVAGHNADVVICLPPECGIMTSDGVLEIGDIVNNETQTNVLGFDHKTGLVVEQPILAFEKNPGRPCVTIEFSDGSTLDCTTDHPVFTTSRGYVRAEDLFAGEECVDAGILRDLQRGDRQGTEALGANQSRPVLQQGVFFQAQHGVGESGVQKENGEVLPELRKNHVLDPIRHEKDPQLLNEVPGRVLEEGGVANLSRKGPSKLLLLQQGVSSLAEGCKAEAEILYEALRELGTQPVDDGGGEWPVCAWAVAQSVSGRLQVDEAEDFGARQERVSSLREEPGEGPQFGRTPHRLQQEQQFRNQPDFPVSLVPRSDARTRGRASALETKTVKDIKGRPTPDFVYNIRTGTHNYFAEQTLTHNCDDPHNTTEAQSEANLEAVRQWWNGGMAIRMNDPAKLKRVLIMQRVSEKDLTALLLRQGGWEHLCLAAEFEPERKCKTSIGFEDWRTEPGELLWPERFTQDALVSLKASMDWDKYKISSQLQQNPTPTEGGLFKKEYWQTWVGPMPDFIAIIQSWDTALETKTHNDYSVCTTWGIFTQQDTLGDDWGSRKGHEYTRYCMMLLECVDKRLEGPDLREEAMRLYKMRRPDFVIVERKASGHNLIQEMRRSGLPVIPFDPRGNDKMARANAAAIMWQQGCIYIPDKEWTKKVVAQHTVFPNGDFDDIVDSCVQAALFTRRKFWVTLSGEWDDDDSPPEPKVLRGFYD